MGLDFIVIAPLTVSLWLLLCRWMWGIFFGEFQCLPVDDCSAVSCDSGALARGSECMSFYSILNCHLEPICVSFLLIRTPVLLELGPTLIQYDLILTGYINYSRIRSQFGWS